MIKKEKFLGEILVEHGLITMEQFKMALLDQLNTKEFLGIVLLRHGWIDEKKLLLTLSEQFHLPWIDLSDRYIDWGMVKGFSTSLILDHHCVPIEKDERSVTIAITNPLDAWALKKAEEEARGLKINFVLISESNMRDTIARYRVYVQKNLNKLFDA